MGLDTDFKYGVNVYDDDNNPFPDGETQLCMGRVKCVHCGKPYGYCSEVEANLTTVQENLNMLPQAGGNSSSSSSGGKRTTGLPYIKTQDLSRDKAEARVIDVRVAPEAPEGTRNYSDVRVKIAIMGRTMLYGLKVNNPEYAKLQAAFGSNESDWVGRRFYMFTEEDEFDNKLWVRVEPIHADKEAKAGRGKN